MKPKWCLQCGAAYKGWGKRGLCPSCAQAAGWRKRRERDSGIVQGPAWRNPPDERYGRDGRVEAVTGITANMRFYGKHPHCAGCGKECGIYAAPHSRILYCPRMHPLVVHYGGGDLARYGYCGGGEI